MPSPAVYLAQGLTSLKSRLPDWPHWRRELPSDPEEVSSPAALARLIESEIIPRLLVAHGPATKLRLVEPRSAATVEQSDVLAFATLAIEADAASLLDFADTCIARGVTIEDILLELIVSGARELGMRWEEDRVDFIDVTMGLWRMQELAYELMARVPVSGRMSRYRALFSSMPQDQHSFGPLMVEEFFRVAGWQTRSLIEPDREALVTLVGRGDYDLCGLTVTRQEDIATLPKLIRDMRGASPNPKLIVLVGGRMVPDEAGFIETCGADGTAGDARDAVTLAAELLHARVETAAAS